MNQVSGETHSVKEERAELIAASDPPTGTPGDIAFAIDILEGEQFAPPLKASAYKVLERLEGSGISERIHQELTSAESMPIRIQLSRALAERNYTPAVPTILAASQLAASDEERLQLLQSVRTLADLRDINPILASLSGDHSLPVRKMIEDTLLAILRRGGETDAVVETLLSKITSTTSNERKSLFRVLGVLGGEKVRERVANIYRDGEDPELKRDALLAYLNWQNRAVISNVESLINTTEDIAVRAVAIRAYVRLVTLPGPEPLAERVAIWNIAFEMAENQNDVRLLTASLLEHPGPETLSLLDRWQSHPIHGPLARSAIVPLEKKIQSVMELKTGESLKGNTAHVQGGTGAAINSALSSLTEWVSPETWFTWNFKSAESGLFYVEVDQATLRENPSQFVIYLADTTLKAESTTTPSLDAFVPVRPTGSVTLEAGQIYTLTLTAGEIIQPRMMDIGAIRLVKP